jgi:phage baseplate assembly protein W
MAIIVRNRFPIDLAAQKALGVNIPFSAPAVFSSNYITKDAIKNNLINFYSTEPGERVFNPFFGSALKRIVFEQIDVVTNDLIKKIISDETNKFFPFVSIISTIIDESNSDQNTITINVTYQVSNFGITDALTIVL